MRTVPRFATPGAWSTDSLERGSLRSGLTGPAAARKLDGSRFVSNLLTSRRRRSHSGTRRCWRPCSACTCSLSRSTMLCSTGGCGRCAPCRAPLRRELAELVVPLPVDAAELRPPSATTPLRGLRDGARTLALAAAPTSPHSSSCVRSTTTAADAVRAAADPRRPGGARARAEAGGHARRRARRAAGLALRRSRASSSSASPRLLEAYWEEAFAAEWRRIEPSSPRASTPRAAQIAGDGIYAFLLGLAPQLRVEPGAPASASTSRTTTRRDRRREPAAARPSVYVWPHVRVNCDPPWPLTVVYRAPQLAESLRHATPPELVQLLRALADPTRLRILAARSPDRPRSTQELAPLVGLSEAGTSKHLRLLAEAGVSADDSARATTSSTRSSRRSWRRSPPSSATCSAAPAPRGLVWNCGACGDGTNQSV